MEKYCAIIFLMALAGCDANNFEDCILKNMQGATSDVAANQIRRSCREKFPENAGMQERSRDLKPWERASITGRADLMSGNQYGGSLYNGNKEITITQVHIAIAAKGGEFEDAARTYAVDIVIPPKTTKNFSFDIVAGYKDSNYSWAIAAAKGFEK